MSKSLIYFDISGLAESLRYLLHYSGIKFEDVRIPRSEWAAKKSEISPPFGKLPIFKDGDRVLNQSMAIARYIGRSQDLVPADPWEEAFVDAVILTLQDFNQQFLPYFREKDPIKKSALRKELTEETIPFYFSRFEKILKENNGHFGKKLTWADFVFVGYLDFLLHGQLNVTDRYPTVKKLAEHIYGFPGVAEYIASRKK